MKRTKKIKKINFESHRRTKNKGIRLTGILENPSAKKCVILVHGFLDDKDGNGRWTALSKNLQKEGYAVFRFDFAEHGESDKAPISITGEIQDLQAAIDLMKEKYERIALVGHSLGGLCSLKLANQAACVVSWAGATDSSVPTAMLKSVIKEDKETMIFKVHDREYVASKKYLEERKELDVEELISSIRVPALLIHGTDDKHIPISQTYNAEKYLKKGRIKIIHEEDHFFLHKLNEVIAITTDFINKNL